MGLFDRKEEPKPDFSNVQSGSSTRPDSARTPNDTRIGSTYTVKSGDTLSAIAQREYGDAGAWKRIYEANRDLLTDPDVIHPGQELKIPARDGGAT